MTHENTIGTTLHDCPRSRTEVLDYWSVGILVFTTQYSNIPSLRNPVFLSRLFHQILDQKRPDLSRIREHLGVDAVLLRFAPGFIFGVGAAGKMAEVRFVRADPHAVAETPVGISRSKPFVDDLDQRRHVLHVITRHTATDGKN